MTLTVDTWKADMDNALARYQRSMARLTDLTVQMIDSDERSAIAFNLLELSEAVKDMTDRLAEVIRFAAEKG